MSTDNPSNNPEPTAGGNPPHDDGAEPPDVDSEATPPYGTKTTRGAGGTTTEARKGHGVGPGGKPGGAGPGFLPAPTPADVDSSGDAPVAVVTSGVAEDDDPDVLEPTQIMPPLAARPGAYGQLGPAPGPDNPDQPWGPGTPAGGYPIPGPPPYGQPPGPGTPGYGQSYAGAEGAPPYDFGSGLGTPSGPKPRRLLLAGGMVAALVVVGGGSFLGVRALTSGPDHPNPPPGAARKPSAVPSTPAQSAPPNGGIDSVRTDGKAMTVAEAFPSKTVSADGVTFTQVRATVQESCKDAAKGDFVKALRNAGCQRVVGATFVDKHKKYAVSAGIAALPTKADATRADHAADSRKGSWFAPLTGKKGSGADKIDTVGGYAATLVWGRYIVFSYATYSNGRTPGAKDKHLAELSQDFRDTATKAIAARASS